MANTMSITLAIVLLWMFLLWLVSLVKRDASIVDIFWGIGFIGIATVSFVVGQGYYQRKALIFSLTAVWGLRLAGHIFWRNRGKGEDFRYQAMRRRYGSRFPVVSLLLVFVLQGILMWVVSFPLQVAMSSSSPGLLTWLDFLGAAVWTTGFLFESVGDLQLARFKADPGNKGKVMDRGLWRYTRHPNYFGDALLWWGLFLIASGVPGGYYTIMSPLVMTFLLMRVSGVALLEKTLVKTRPEYAEYTTRTSAFFPRPPRKSEN